MSPSPMSDQAPSSPSASQETPTPQPGAPVLGTPWTRSATKVALLGAGEIGKEVTIALSRLGVEITAIDRYDGAPAQQVAHNALTVDMSDPEALTAAIRSSGATIVVPEIEALATDALVALEQAGEVRVVPTARAVQLTMNREGIRRLAAEELGLPTSPYAFASCLEELVAGAQQVGFPCVVKPVMSSSGHGQSVVRGPEDLDAAWHYAACEPIGHRQVDGDYVESWQPQSLNQAALKRAQQVAEAVTAALGGWGLFGVELFIRGEEVLFSEVSPRPHDTGLVTLASQRLSEFELHARALLGLPVDTLLRSPGASVTIKATGDSAHGEGVSFAGLDEALMQHGVDLRLFGKPEAHPGRRLGVVVACADRR